MQKNTLNTYIYQAESFKILTNINNRSFYYSHTFHTKNIFNV